LSKYLNENVLVNNFAEQLSSVHRNNLGPVSLALHAAVIGEYSVFILSCANVQTSSLCVNTPGCSLNHC